MSCAGSSAGARGGVPTLRRRADFKRLARGMRRNAADFTLQAAPAIGDVSRFGFTVTRKIGHATERNRIKRRLRAAVASLPETPPLIDAVVIARRSCLSRTFADLQADLVREWTESRRRLTRPGPERPGEPAGKAAIPHIAQPLIAEPHATHPAKPSVDGLNAAPPKSD